MARGRRFIRQMQGTEHGTYTMGDPMPIPDDQLERFQTEMRRIVGDHELIELNIEIRYEWTAGEDETYDTPATGDMLEVLDVTPETVFVQDFSSPGNTIRLDEGDEAFQLIREMMLGAFATYDDDWTDHFFCD